MSTINDIPMTRQQRLAEERRAEQAARLERDRLAQQGRLEQERLRLEAADRRREQDREDRRLEAEERRKAAELAEAQRRQREEAARAAKAQVAKERARERAKARAARRARWAAYARSAPGWVAQHLDLAAALVVMGCSIIPALISQASQLSDFHLNLVLVALLPVMLECSAWAATAAETKALKAGRTAWPYRVAVWAFASLAAWVNYQHGVRVGGAYGSAVGTILAASSLVPVGLWQLIQLGRHQEAKAAQRAARRKARDERRDRKARGKRYPQVWDAALKLRAVAGHGRLSEQQAWEAAWAVFEGAGEDALPADLLALLSAEMLGIRVEAEERLGTILRELHRARAERLAASGQAPAGGASGRSAQAAETASDRSVYVSADGGSTPPTRTADESATGLVDRFGRPLFRTVSPQINQFVPAPARASGNEPARTPAPARANTPRTRRQPAGRNLSEGAKKAASVTARNASADEAQDINAWVADQIRSGRTVDGKAVKAEVMRRRIEANAALPKRRQAKIVAEPGKTWIYDRINAGKKLAASGSSLHVVRDERSA